MTEPTAQPDRGFVADSLAVGMAVMLAMTVVQRGLGFFRGIWFCRMLDDAIVGQWSMAYDFMTLVTPIVLLGIPGSLPRYVEPFRARGHLRSLVQRMSAATLVLGGLFFLTMLAFPRTFGWVIFLRPGYTQLVYAVAAGMLAIVFYDFVYGLVSSLRQVRVASLMQFIQSVAFTFIAVAWLGSGGGLVDLVVAFIAASGLAMVPGLLTLRRGWSTMPSADDTFDAAAMWRRLLPFAAAIWSMNLLTNVFAMSDRYMILHWMPGSDAQTQAAVGQYHSGRIIPMLLCSLASMVSGVLLPYLTADWEAGRHGRVKLRIRQMVFAMSAAFTAGAAVTLWMAPWFFATVLEDRYPLGLAMMPMTFVYCIWMSMTTLGQDYLWVREKGKWVALALAVALASNLGLNHFLLPIWGLTGAVLATLIANAVLLSGLWIAMRCCGYPIDATAILATFLPLTLLAGSTAALVSIVVATGCNGTVRGWCGEALAAWRARRPGPT